MNIDKQFADHFAEQWLNSWNAHDLDGVLIHYTDKFEMNSPLIASRLGITDGILRGKTKIRAYWADALKAYPDLKFELLKVLYGVSSITIYYLGATGQAVAETFLFNDSGKVFKAFANYS
jgi:hypothetical protein